MPGGGGRREPRLDLRGLADWRARASRAGTARRRSGGSSASSLRRLVQLRVIAEDALLVERKPPFRGEIAVGVGAARHRRGQRNEMRPALLRVGEGAREGVAYAGPEVEAGRICRRRGVADIGITAGWVS